MAATFGVEAIRHFGNARANGVSTAADLTYTFNRSNGFDDELRSSGHTRAFYWSEQDVWSEKQYLRLPVGVRTAADRRSA